MTFFSDLDLQRQRFCKDHFSSNTGKLNNPTGSHFVSDDDVSAEIVQNVKRSTNGSVIGVVKASISILPHGVLWNPSPINKHVVPAHSLASQIPQVTWIQIQFMSHSFKLHQKTFTVLSRDTLYAWKLNPRASIHYRKHVTVILQRFTLNVNSENEASFLNGIPL